MNWSCGKYGRWKPGKDAQKVGEMEARKTDIAIGDCIKSYIERVGEEW